MGVRIQLFSSLASLSGLSLSVHSDILGKREKNNEISGEVKGNQSSAIEETRPRREKLCSDENRPIIQDKKEGAGPRESLNAKNTNAALFV